MAFVHKDSTECMKPELDLFSVPPTQTCIENGCWTEYHPISSLTDRGPIEFDVPGNGEEYLDLKNTYLYVKARIVAANGNNLADTARTAPTNLFLHSLFSQVDISLNGTQITSATNMYPYRAMIEKLISYGSDAKKSQLTAELYYKDTAGQMDSTEITGVHQNEGFMQRKKFCQESASFDMTGRIHADMFFQQRYLLNEVNLKVKLVRSKSEFCVMDQAAGAKVIIQKATLIVRKVKLTPSLFLAQASALEQATAKYPIRRVVCKSFAIPAGITEMTQEKVFSGQLPARVVIGMVKNTAFAGTYRENPFNFQHFRLSELNLTVDGQQQKTIREIDPDFENHLFVNSYLSLFSGTGKINQDEGLDLTRSDFENGYSLFVYDLSPDMAEDDHFNLAKDGSLRISLKFADALASSVSVIVYAEFENVIEIDRNRNIIFDFAS